MPCENATFGLEVLQKLPEGSSLRLDVPEILLAAIETDAFLKAEPSEKPDSRVQIRIAQVPNSHRGGCVPA